MMKLQLLFTLIYFCLELEAHDLSPPKLTVDVSVMRETDSVTLKCQSPSLDSTSECSFFTLSETLFEGRCLQTLTGAELLNRVTRRSPATIEVRCFYTVKDGTFLFTSADSDASTIEINNLLPPDLIVNPQLISEKDSVTLNCQTPVSLTECYWLFEGRSQTTRFSCFYLNFDKSPKSEQKTITIQFPQPELRVNPAVITDRDSATLNCVTPSSLSVSECHFHFLRAKTTRISSCMQTLTAAELLSISSQRSPADVELTCLYSVEQQEGNSQSPRSNVSYIRINLLPPDLIVNPQLISEKDSVTLNCQTPVSLTECYWLFEGKSQAEQFSCSKTLTGAELITMTSQRVPAKVQVSCFYLNGATSPESEQKTITIQYVERKRTSVTSADSWSGDLTTGTPKISGSPPSTSLTSVNPDSENPQIHLSNGDKWEKLLALPAFAVAVCVIVLGWTLCWSNRESDFKKISLENPPNPDGGLKFNPGIDETWSVVTYFPVTVRSAELVPVQSE